MKRTRFTVYYLSGYHIARFSAYAHAMAYARQESLDGRIVNVDAHDGLIGQFENGKATEEFEHLDNV